MRTPERVKTEGLTVNCRVEGEGPPLLYLGGSNFDLSIRAAVFDSRLPRHFTVAAADPRGLGGTDAPDGQWSMEDYARDALHLLDALEWDRVDVLGESFGAMTALHLAALAPGRLGRMALSAGSPGGAGGSSYPIHEFREIEDPRQRARAALEILDCRFADLARQSPVDAEAMIDARIATEAAFLASHANSEGFPRLLQARAGHDAWSKLPDIKVPTLVFAGRYDRQAPPDRSENIARALPNAMLHIVDGGHSICFATEEPVARILAHWAR